MGAVGAVALAKKKTTKRAAGPEPERWSRQPQAINLRGSPEWKRWVEDLAKANRLSVAGLIDQALAKVARDMGFREPPERS